MIRTMSTLRTGRALAATALLPVAALVLAGCGGATASTPAGAGGTTASPPSAGAGGPGNGSRRGPAASGEIAAASPGALQVQNSTSQTTVTYTKSTRFSKTVTAVVAAGDCVTATGTPVSGSSDALTATTVRVVSVGAGACRLADNGDRNGRPGGTPPTGAPGGAGPGGNGGNVAVAFGTVTSVSGSTVRLSGNLRAGFRPSTAPAPYPSASPPATPSAVPVTVTLTSSTTVTKAVSATSAAATVGRCATAEGTTDSKGAVAATSIVVSDKGPNGCSFGGGRRFGGGGSG